jgi:hypothetical protein
LACIGTISGQPRLHTRQHHDTMLDTFTIETFQPKLGELFHVVAGNQRLPTKLTEVRPWERGATEGRTRLPFVLVFHTVPQAVLPQGTYMVETDGMERFELFLVPLSPDERGMRYQAVFA